MNTATTFRSLLIAILLLLAGIAIGRWLLPHSMPMQHAAEPAGNEILYWVAPMDASYRRDGPGKSPMGMDLVPVYANQSGGNDEANSIRVPAHVLQNLGVRTATAEQGTLPKVVKAVGITEWDESSTHMLHTRVEGWLQQLNIASDGETVNKGEVLFTVFSPKLVSAQQEFLTARASGNRGLVRAAERRLLSLGLTEDQLEKLNKTGQPWRELPHIAEHDAIVTELHVRNGMYVEPRTNIATLADNHKLWLRLQVPESQAAQIMLGQTVRSYLDSRGAEPLLGKVEYIYPSIDPQTRSLQVRVALSNLHSDVRVDQFVSADIEINTIKPVIHVPREAVIRSAAGNRVLLALADGEFKVQPVEIGHSYHDKNVIHEGLQVGDQVVTSGQFLLDSEANGEQALARLNAEKMAVEKPGSAALTGAVIVAIEQQERRLQLDHEAIESLGMGAMTMTFMVAPDIDIAALKAGQSVQFAAEMKPGEGILITELQAQSDHQHSQPEGSEQ